MVSRIFARLSPAFVAKTPAMFGWIPISEVRKLARFFSFFFRHELQDGSILVQDPMLMVNCSLSTPITILPDGLFIYKELAAKLCGIYHYDASRTNTKFLQKHY